VATEPGELVTERVRRTLVLDGFAEEVAERGEEVSRFGRIIGDEGGDGVERIAEEMRLQVLAQTGELGRLAHPLGLDRAQASVVGELGVAIGEHPQRVRLQTGDGAGEKNAHQLCPAVEKLLEDEDEDGGHRDAEETRGDDEGDGSPAAPVEHMGQRAQGNEREHDVDEEANRPNEIARRVWLAEELDVVGERSRRRKELAHEGEADEDADDEEDDDGCPTVGRGSRQRLDKSALHVRKLSANLAGAAFHPTSPRRSTTSPRISVTARRAARRARPRAGGAES